MQLPYFIISELRRGWWRITDADQFQTIVNNLHPRGARERELKRTITRPCLELPWDTMLKVIIHFFILYLCLFLVANLYYDEGNEIEIIFCDYLCASIFILKRLAACFDVVYPMYNRIDNTFILFEDDHFNLIFINKLSFAS